jgi:hypothetical protein
LFVVKRAGRGENVSSFSRKSNRERLEKLLERMPRTWVPYQELVKSAGLSTYELRRYLVEAKKKKQVTNMRKQITSGHLCYWRKL